MESGKEVFGLAGLILILIGWVMEIGKKQKMPIKFAALYAAGSLFLTIYSLQ
ncbi:MAG: hypothetical protein QXN37_01490 [Candidatus Anstonellaceae archaeon]